VAELVFLKLGGSLITDKRRFESARPDVIQRLAAEIRSALDARPDLHLVLGHGSGSYGHFHADRYHVREGHIEEWVGYAHTSAAAQRLNRLVTDTLLSAGVPVVSLQPSASAMCRDGQLQSLAIEPVAQALAHGLVPLVYGDVAWDTERECTIISTEDIFARLARSLCPRWIIEAGEVDGVHSGDPQRDAVVRLIPEISRTNYFDVEQMLSTSFGVDVTGGMLSKVASLYRLVQEQPTLGVRIITGTRPGVLQRLLIDPTASEGTWIHF
jgi:isopentenyl phosphate kinase